MKKFIILMLFLIGCNSGPGGSGKYPSYKDFIYTYVIGKQWVTEEYIKGNVIAFTSCDSISSTPVEGIILYTNREYVITNECIVSIISIGSWTMNEEKNVIEPIDYSGSRLNDWRFRNMTEHSNYLDILDIHTEDLIASFKMKLK